MITFLDLHSQYLEIKSEIDQAIADVLKKSAFIGGEYVERFEAAFATYQESAHCIGVANGTDALEIAIEALDLPRESDILVPANSFIASSEAVTRSGHNIVFCDCDAENYTISIADIRKKITPKTKAIMAVHLYGHPCDMDELKHIATQYQLKIIEDCAQAHGAEYKGKRVGAIGDIGTFSFYPGKNLGAYGDAGCIVTQDSELAKKSRMIANHGRIEKYNHQFEGRNSRLDGLQAAILSVKLNYLDLWTSKRIETALQYTAALRDVRSFELPACKEWAKCVYHLFVVRTQNREEVQEKLKQAGIQTGVHYPISLPKLQAYSYLKNQETPTANRYDRYLLSLPIGEHLNKEDVEKIIKTCHEL